MSSCPELGQICQVNATPSCHSVSQLASEENVKKAFQNHSAGLVTLNVYTSQCFLSVDTSPDTTSATTITANTVGSSPATGGNTTSNGVRKKCEILDVSKLKCKCENEVVDKDSNEKKGPSECYDCKQ